MNQDSTRKARVNVRRAEVMEQVEKEIQQHYQSELISHIRSAGNTEFFLAREFGFCNGVRRAIDIAYAARRVFPDRRIFLIGDIIHNPEVNRQLEEMGIRKLPWKQLDSSYDRADCGYDMRRRDEGLEKSEELRRHGDYLHYPR